MCMLHVHCMFFFSRHSMLVEENDSDSDDETSEADQGNEARLDVDVMPIESEVSTENVTHADPQQRVHQLVHQMLLQPILN